MGTCAFSVFVWKVVSPQIKTVASRYPIDPQHAEANLTSNAIYTQSNRPLFSLVQWEVPSSKYVLMLLFGASKHCPDVSLLLFWLLVYYCITMWKADPMLWNVQKLPYNPFNYIFYLLLYTAKRLMNNQVHACIHKYGFGYSDLSHAVSHDHTDSRKTVATPRSFVQLTLHSVQTCHKPTDTLQAPPMWGNLPQTKKICRQPVW